MDHREYIRTVPGSRMAVLMIHGIAGTPAHFRQFEPLIPQDWSVYNILLDGHGKEVEDFSATSMKKWRSQVSATLEELLSRHEKVLIVAHSMGTLFAIRAAVDHPDRIPLLFLLSVPTRPWVRFSTWLTCLRVAFGAEDPAATAMRNDTSIRLHRKLWRYIGWVPRLLELLAEIRQVRKLLPRLEVPCLTFQSHTDELVSARSCKDLENHPWIHNTVLHGSGHFAYGPEDSALLRSRLAEMIEKIIP